MHLIARTKKALRGNVSLTTVAREIVRLGRVRLSQLRERRTMSEIEAAPARLSANFARLTDDELFEHLRKRKMLRLWAEFQEFGELQRREFPDETAELLAVADKIANENSWEVGGFGEITFDKPDYWRRDPLTGADWGLDYHADLPIYTPGGPDIRVLWELNRFGHVLILARAFFVTGEERFAETFFRHLEEWAQQNPYARGANWRSPMDVIMRAVNVVAAFELIRTATCCTPERVALVLKIADTHCRFTLGNREFSYVATGNHYITNVAGLFFVATLLPELEHATEWRDFGLSKLLRECKKQVLPDGADWESSTGYHKFVTEILLTCLIIAERNGIEIEEEHHDRCRNMLRYLRAIIRPDGGMPLVGDCDGSQFLPIVRRDGDDAKYLLDLGSVFFDKAEFKIGDECSPEVLWLFGSDGAERYSRISVSKVASAQFPYAGTYILRDDDLYVMLNANDVGLNGRGSHSHNDALSIEVSALGHAWIVDPGSYVYNLDREARHRFRLTSAHSTLMIDGREQNEINVDQPFVSANDARPELVEWRPDEEVDSFKCEHSGYSPLIHRREVGLDRTARYFLIMDELIGRKAGPVYVSFHLAPGVTAEIENNQRVNARCGNTVLALLVSSPRTEPEVIDSEFSKHYGGIEPCKVVRWRVDNVHRKVLFSLVPLAEGDDRNPGLVGVRGLYENNS